MTKLEELEKKDFELREIISNAINDGDERLVRKATKKFVENDLLLNIERKKNGPKHLI